jgi:hypothetical protein
MRRHIIAAALAVLTMSGGGVLLTATSAHADACVTAHVNLNVVNQTQCAPALPALPGQ